MSPQTHGQLTPLSDEEIAQRLTELHYVLFRQLPDEGQMYAFRPMTTSVKFIRDRLNQTLPGHQKLTSYQILAELRSLKQYGLVNHATNPLSGSPAGWQRTRRAKELLDQFDQKEEPHVGS